MQEWVPTALVRQEIFVYVKSRFHRSVSQDLQLDLFLVVGDAVNAILLAESELFLVVERIRVARLDAGRGHDDGTARRSLGVLHVMGAGFQRVGLAALRSNLGFRFFLLLRRCRVNLLRSPRRVRRWRCRSRPSTSRRIPDIRRCSRNRKWRSTSAGPERRQTVSFRRWNGCISCRSWLRRRRMPAGTSKQL